MADLERDIWEQLPEEQEALFAEINITPLTDIILVLLIIFMVSSSAMVDAAREGRLEISLPQAQSAASDGQEAPTVVIGLTADGKKIIDGKMVSDTELKDYLSQTHKERPDSAIVVDADGALTHKQVVSVIDSVRAAGFLTVHFGAAEPP